jgi:rare lipoprotein A
VLTVPVAATPRTESMEMVALPLMAPIAAPAPGPAALPVGPSAGSSPAVPSAGFWVQLGAFSQRDGALRFQQVVAREMPALAPSLNVFSERGTHRLQAGPYASRELARDTADQARSGLQVAPVIVERR